MISIYDTGSYRMTMLSYNVEKHSFALFNFFFSNVDAERIGEW